MDFPLRILPSAQNAYRFLTAERNYILRLAIFPVIIKLICYTTGLSLGYDNNILRMGLILVPAVLVEGWMLSHVVRLITLGQRWPFQPTGDDEADIAVLEPRMRGVLGGLITYTLIHLIITGAMAFVMALNPAGMEAMTADAQAIPSQTLAVIVLMGVGVWAFPLLWLYIPIASGMEPKGWIQEIRGLKFSVPMMGVWLLCYLPVAAITLLGVSAILSPFAADAIPAGANFAVVIIGVVLDTVKALLATAGITFALMEYYHGGQKGTQA